MACGESGEKVAGDVDLEDSGDKVMERLAACSGGENEARAAGLQ